MKWRPICLAFGFFVLLVVLASSRLSVAEHQTPTVSPIVVGGSLPYTIEIIEYDFGVAEFPTLQSYAAGEHNGLWVFVAGRTNGLHGQGAGGFGNFPPAFQNREIWVVDPVAKQSWHRSLEDASSGLSTEQIDSITVTNNQFYQESDRIYMTGGYGYDRDTSLFKTYDTLTAIDLPGIIAWTQGGTGVAADHIRQLHDEVFRVTGGAMVRIGAKSHLVFGQNFDGGYSLLQNGIYTKQVRTFEIIDDGNNLSISGVVQTTPTDAYRRRDLNVVPRVSRNAGTGELEFGIVALSGVFTPTNGVWTVPAEIDASGSPSMADPNLATTFKQGMHNYHSAKIGLFSESTNAMHLLSFGGITLQYYDYDVKQFVTDNLLPFNNQVTSIVVDSAGKYTQYLLPEEFPEIFDGDNRLRFGANAEFMVKEGVPTYENGAIKLDAISAQTTIGYIVGGIVADAGNHGNSAASGHVFEVILTPTPSLLADFDADGNVDGNDFLAWQTGFGMTSGAAKSDGDADGDADVDGNDFLIWQAEFGSTLAGGAASMAIPQPAAAVVTAAASYGELLRRRATRRCCKKYASKRH